MQYYSEMQSKYGFADGEAIPPDAHICRTLYCQVLNSLAEKHGSQFRAVEFNRSGAHNSCLLLVASKDNPKHFVEETDEGWQEAVYEAHELDLDQYVETQSEVRWDTVNAVLKEVEAPPVTEVEVVALPCLLGSRQLATVLAALRHWQQITREREVEGVAIQDIPANLQLHFVEHSPLSQQEIDELCARLNGATE